MTDLDFIRTVEVFGYDEKGTPSSFLPRVSLVGE